MKPQTLVNSIYKEDDEFHPAKGLGSLRPITSQCTRRYENKTSLRGELLTMDISPGLFGKSHEPEPEYLAALWSAHIHPEGQLYFYREGPLRVVTEAFLYRPETFDIACRWIEHLERRVLEIMANSEDMELFIELDGQSCGYYFVDHATCSQFWLESSDTDQLGLPQVASTSQLKIVLEELYWVHVEHFPMHLSPLPIQKLEDLVAVFSHGLCDQMTSRDSTFLYPAKDCESFVRVLHGCRDNMSNGHTTWIIGSKWDHNRYLTFYSQEYSRLSRTQSVLWNPEQRYPWISKAMSYLTFNISRAHQTSLDDVFVDHMVYEDQWEKLAENCLQQLHLPFLLLKSPHQYLPIISTTAFGGALGYSIVLQHTVEPLKKLSASDAMNYLESIHSPVFKFQWTAFAFSFPKALLLWGYTMLFVDYFSMIPQFLGPAMALCLLGLLLLGVVILYSATSASLRDWLGTISAQLCQRSVLHSIEIV
ncbi:hypothetical protein R3P38DRAFT_3069521 [Favolaschia claudopus]|uniref:Uncharacterized protein n=1 Tax=Favolaschia claudopus TaxID=2862362 RepID=A0AAV9ZZE5_9AGAR